MSVSLELWLPDVLPSLPGCPESTVLRAIRDAAVEFCNRSQIWRFEVEPFPVVKGIADYQLDIPAGTHIAAFIRVKHADRQRPLELRTTEELDDKSPGWRSMEGQPAYFVQHGVDGVLLDRLPKETRQNVLSATLALKPTNSATAVDDLLFFDWKEEIADGARSRLMGDANRQWSNPMLAQEKRKNFTSAIHRAALKARLGSGSRSLSVQKRNIY